MDRAYSTQLPVPTQNKAGINALLSHFIVITGHKRTETKTAAEINESVCSKKVTV